MREFVSTCSACGGFGHNAGPDGLCSRTSLALRDYEAGALAREAAERHGLSPGSIWSAAYLLRKQPDVKEQRLMVIRSRVMRRWYRLRQQAWVQAMVMENDRQAEPPEVSELPPIPTAGADHAEIPDPPALLEVGWRTGRR
jgi:hypothetical protein